MHFFSPYFASRSKSLMLAAAVLIYLRTAISTVRNHFWSGASLCMVLIPPMHPHYPFIYYHFVFSELLLDYIRNCV